MLVVYSPNIFEARRDGQRRQCFNATPIEIPIIITSAIGSQSFTGSKDITMARGWHDYPRAYLSDSIPFRAFGW
jgi:hypothetical protein